MRALGRPTGLVSVPVTPVRADTQSRSEAVQAKTAETAANQHPPSSGSATQLLARPESVPSNEVIIVDDSSSMSKSVPLESRATSGKVAKPMPAGATPTPPSLQASASSLPPSTVSHTSPTFTPTAGLTEDMDVVEEVSTPGVLELAYNEAQQLRVGSRLRPVEEDAPLKTATPPTPPRQSSVASPPPVSRSSSPTVAKVPHDTTGSGLQFSEVTEYSSTPKPLLHRQFPRSVVGSVSHAQALPGPQEPLDDNAMDSDVSMQPATTIMSSSPTTSQHGKGLNPDPDNISRSPKEPLFLVSPRSSADSVVEKILISSKTPDGATDVFVPSGLLNTYPLATGDKVKGRARDSDEDVPAAAASPGPARKRRRMDKENDGEGLVGSSDVNEVMRAPRQTGMWRRRYKVEVVIPPPSELVRRAKAQIARRRNTTGSPSRTPWRTTVISDSDSSSEIEAASDAGDHST